MQMVGPYPISLANALVDRSDSDVESTDIPGYLHLMVNLLEQEESSSVGEEGMVACIDAGSACRVHVWSTCLGSTS